MSGKARFLVALIVSAGLLAAGSGSGSLASPAGFSPHVTNPYFPLVPGRTLVYRGVKDGKPARDEFTVSHKTAVIGGARCAVVLDRLYLNGRLAERTTDWYTQDSAGNVWYYGESTAELDASGRVKSTEGSWRTGSHGAIPGIFMPASPKVGASFRQEYYKGHAEDHFRVLDLNASVSVPYKSSEHALLTKEWTPLEPAVTDHKHYLRGIGTVREEAVRGPTERLLLVSIRRR